MKNLDGTLDYMENARFNYLYAPEIARLEKETSFKHTELTCVVMIYHKFVLENGERAKFMTLMQLSSLVENVFGVTDQTINANVVSRISFDPDFDHPDFSADRHCNLRSFIKLFDIYFTDDLEKRMVFCFSVYDRTDFNYLDREVVQLYVDKFFEGDDEDEVFELRQDMVELIFLKFDQDKDTFISAEEYYDVVRQQPMLLQFLGPVFPTTRQKDIVAHCANIMSCYAKNEGNYL
ncbi:uncharacterized protein LOC117188072 [Drosophila miranda]|uniref:uncharacterized protein LOC117188072 n=1 Tax=Drosophila miranda TaxID=7229 RepID=UPI0007E7CC0F|nr:uncharacterized protein LOC117188072 [Drosophila miranda]